MADEQVEAGEKGRGKADRGKAGHGSMAQGGRTKHENSVARLLAYEGDRRGLTYVGCALSGLAALLNIGVLVCVWFVARDLVVAAPDFSSAEGAARYGLAAVAFAVAALACYFAALMCTHVGAFRAANNMRRALLAHLARVPLGFFDTHASGELRRVIEGSCDLTENVLAHKLPDLVGALVTPVAFVVVMLAFDWRMGLACLAPVVVAALLMRSMMVGAGNADYRTFMANYQGALDRMNKAAVEYVRGIPVVKVFQQTVFSFKAFRESVDDYVRFASGYVRMCKAPQVGQMVAVNATFVTLVPAGILLAAHAGDFPTFLADFLFYLVFSALTTLTLNKVMYASQAFTEADDAVRRVGGILEAPEQSVPARGEAARAADASLSFEDVSFTYPGAREPALSHVSLEVPAGATVALVGPSGGGKSTLASLVPRFWDTTSGTVRVGGADVRAMDPHDLMGRVAFVFQNERLFAASLLDNVRAARPSATREEVAAALSVARCDDVVARLPRGLDTLIGVGGTYLSGGEAQRVALARAILKDAPVVVLDEATAFADPENEALIQQALARLTAGKTVLMIAHRLTTVAGADRIVVLDGGRVAEQGSHAELLAAHGLYARMWADYETALSWRLGNGQDVAGADGRARACAGAADGNDEGSPSPSAVPSSAGEARAEASGDDKESCTGADKHASVDASTRSVGRLTHALGLTAEGARGFARGVACCAVANLALMAPVGLLLALAGSLMAHLETGAPLPGLVPYLLGIAVTLALLVATQWAEYSFTYERSYEESGRKRTRLAEHLRVLPLSFFGRRDLADLTGTIMKDCSDQERLFMHVMPQLFGTAIALLVVIVACAALDWRLALAAFWPAPAAACLMALTMRAQQARTASMEALRLALSGRVQEFLDCAREIRAAGREAAALDELDGRLSEFERAHVASEALTGTCVSCAQAVLKLGVATTVATAVGLLASGQASFAVAFCFLLVVTRVYDPLSLVLESTAELMAMRLSIRRTNDLMDTPAMGGSRDFRPAGHDLAFEHVSFGYGAQGGQVARQVLDDVSFTAREGQVTALVGPSGAGKSTCARLAARFWDPTSGRVTLGGVGLAGVDPEALLADYAVVFQDVTLFDESVADNIRLGRRGATDEEVRAAARAALCDEFVARLPQGYDTPVGENGARLSGGERQRLSIARAILKDAPVVLLDEATASLDAEGEASVQQALSRLLAGRTVLVIAHRMRTVLGADRVVVLRDGRVAEQGSPAELLAAGGEFARMCALQGVTAR